jgi:hypothetical protein
VVVEVEEAATVGATRDGADTTLDFVDITDIGEVRLNLAAFDSADGIYGVLLYGAYNGG